MMKRYFLHWMQNTKSAGLEVNIQADGTFLAVAAAVSMRKNQVCLDKLYASKPLDELLPAIPKELPVALSVTGKGVLMKKVSSAMLAGNYFETLFPNTNQNDFYQSTLESGANSWIFLLRKSIVDRMIEKIALANIRVVQVSIGIVQIDSILPFVTLEHSENITTNQYRIELNSNQEVLEIGTAPGADEREYAVGTDYVPGSHILSFGTALPVLAHSLASLPSLNVKMDQARSDFTYSRYTRKVGLAMLISLLVILLLNFAIYSHYFSLNEAFQVDQHLSMSQRAKESKTEQTLARKLNFLKTARWDGRSTISMYGDRIASLVPENTQLTQLQVNPMVQGVFRDGVRTEFQNDTINVAGMCDDPEDVTIFLNNLKNTTLINSVVMRNYSYKKEKGKGFFNLQIVTK